MKIELPKGSFVTLIKEAGTAWVDDYAPSMGAALAYYTLFSIAPLLLLVISIAGLVFDQEAARGEIFNQLRGLMGADGASAIEALLQGFSKPSTGVAGTVIGLGVLVIGATTVFGELQSALDRIWRAPAREGTSGLWSLLRTRLLSFGMILAIGFLLMVSLVINAGLAAWGKWWAPAFGGFEGLAHAADFVLSFVLTTSAFAIIYRLMPRAKIRWHDVWIGAAITALLFTLGKLLIGLYIGKSGVASGFGGASSIVILLVWVYYSAQIFLMGAEVTWVYAHLYGSRQGERRPTSADLTAPAAAHASTVANPGAAAQVAPAATAPTRSAMQSNRTAS